MRISLSRRATLYILLGCLCCFVLSLLAIVLTRPDSSLTATTKTTYPPAATSLLIQPLTSEAPEQTTTTEATPDPKADSSLFEEIRNDQPLFQKYANKTEAEISLSSEGLMAPIAQPDNGDGKGQGQFRVACQYSHFSYDDPIVFPDQPGESHLHMFFGNTGASASSTKESLLNTGGSTCQGFELNRSAYWVPALLDGQGNVVVPDSIILYYKTYKPAAAQALPQGLQMVAGNVTENNFAPSDQLHWTCGEQDPDKGPGGVKLFGSIQACSGKGKKLLSRIVFPNCWDGTNLSSKDFSHLKTIENQKDCPSSHPVRFPQISILIYYPAVSDVSGWHLSSDDESYREGSPSKPGGTLHAYWFGGWNDNAMNLFIENCIRPGRNCSQGQTGTNKAFTRVSKLNDYEGENFLKLPENSYTKN